MSEIFKCHIIYKESNDLSKGDIGYVEDKDLPELIEKDRFLLSDVRAWGEWKSAEKDYFKNKESKIRIAFKEIGNRIVLIKLEEFDKIMEDYYNKQIKFKHN